MLNPFRFIEFNSRVYPNRPALDDGFNVFSNRQLHALAKKVAAKLRRHGIRPGQLVVTCLPSGLDWIFTLALFHEACLTCSNHEYLPLDPALETDWIITNQPRDHFPAERTLLVDEAWFADLGNDLPADRPQDYPGADALCRLVLTSGTTGQSKATALTLRMVDGRVRSTPNYWSLSRGQLNLMTFSTIGGFMTALSSAFTGDAYFAPSPKGNLEAIRKYGIRSLIGSPLQIAKVLEVLKSLGQRFRSIREIRTAGGALSPALIAGVRQYFDGALFNIYGATEVGGVAMCTVAGRYESAIAGFLLESATVEIVDEAGNPLPANVDGSIRIRTPFMAQGYYKAPEATAQAFRDGWFHPGDRGRLLENGLLVLAGRNSELINRGGVKIDPATLDAFLQDYPGIRDAAAFGLEDTAGMHELAVALVASDELDFEPLRAALQAKFGEGRVPRHFFRVAQIPRNQMGKVMRVQLGQHFTQMLKDGVPPQNAVH